MIIGFINSILNSSISTNESLTGVSIVSNILAKTANTKNISEEETKSSFIVINALINLPSQLLKDQQDVRSK